MTGSPRQRDRDNILHELNSIDRARHYDWSAKVWARILIGFLLVCAVMLVCIFIGALQPR